MKSDEVTVLRLLAFGCFMSNKVPFIFLIICNMYLQTQGLILASFPPLPFSYLCYMLYTSLFQDTAFLQLQMKHQDICPFSNCLVEYTLGFESSGKHTLSFYNQPLILFQMCEYSQKITTQQQHGLIQRREAFCIHLLPKYHSLKHKRKCALVAMEWSWQLSVLGAEVKSGARNTELWTLVGLREGNGVCLQLSLDLGGHFISLPLLSA